MRQAVCDALVARADDPSMVFLTGDLGFMALEPLQKKLGERFINCGVAEQNMFSVAAALAKEGLDVWVYTIAPFCYARALEQIRNDICMHDLPVKMLGNGGGFGYGVMGSTHHAVEDYGVLSTLTNLQVYVPAVLTDIADVLDLAAGIGRPSYIRLGRDERPKGMAVPGYAPWRRITSGDGPIVFSTGPIACAVYAALSALDAINPEFWLVAELPLKQEAIPPELSEAIRRSGRICVIEEHVRHGGLGSMLCQWLAEAEIPLRGYIHLHARPDSISLSGSQTYLRGQSGLGPESIRAALKHLAQIS